MRKGGSHRENGTLCEQARHTVAGLLRLARTRVGCPVLGFLPECVYGITHLATFAFVLQVMRTHFAIVSVTVTRGLLTRTGTESVDEPGLTGTQDPINAPATPSQG